MCKPALVCRYLAEGIMRRSTKVMAVVMTTALAAGSLAGCSGVSMDKYSSTVAATYGDQDIYLDEANFFLRYQQWTQEAMYWDMITAYTGYTDLWTYPSGDGEKTMGDALKERVMAQLLQTRILNEHASDYNVELTDADRDLVAEAVQAVRTNFADEFFQYTNPSDEDMTTWFEQNALASKVWQAVKDAAEVTVTDEECQEFTLSYVLVPYPSEDSDTDETTAADGEESTPALEGEDLANEVLSRLQAGEEFSAFEDELGVKSTTTSYLKNATDNTTDLFLRGVTMATGDVEMFESTDNGWYVVKCDSDLDEEATEKQRETATNDKKEEAFNEVYTAWAEAAPEFKVKSCWGELALGGEKIYVAQTTAASDESETTASDESETTASDAETAAAEESAQTSEEESTEETAAETSAEESSSAQG